MASGLVQELACVGLIDQPIGHHFPGAAGRRPAQYKVLFWHRSLRRGHDGTDWPSMRSIDQARLDLGSVER